MTPKIPELLKQCAVCGNDFIQPKGHLKLYCSPKCNNKIHSTRPERIAYKRKFEKDNAHLYRAWAKAHRAANPELYKSYSRKSQLKHGATWNEQRRNDPKFCEKSAAAMREKLKCPQYRFKAHLAHSMRNVLKGRLNASVFEYLPYTVDDLKIHIARYFSVKNGFTWENYGSVWELEHVVPKSWFKYETVHDVGFKSCWGLQNLRPGQMTFNRQKSDSFAADISQVTTREELDALRATVKESTP